MVYVVQYLIMERFFSINEGAFQWAFLTVPLMNALFAPVVFKLLDLWTEVWDMEPVEH